jgi:hypothetical protein
MAGVSLAAMNECDSEHLVDGQSCANPSQSVGSSLLQLNAQSKEHSARLEKTSPVSAATMLRHELDQSQKLSSIFDRISKNSDVPEMTRQLFSLFRVCGQCTTFVRLGEANDGGYLTCVDHNATNPSIGAFSLGVEQHDKWSEDVVTILGAQQVHQYDCTIEAPPVLCPRCTFYKKCIRGASDDTSWTLHEAIDQAGYANAADASLIMKMDIEGSEWGVLKDFGQDDLHKFKQITIEYHHIDVEADHEKYVTDLMNLKNSGFAPIHIHGNNYEGMYTIGELTVPNVLEVTYLRDAGTDNCVADQQFKTLDAPNDPTVPELPAAHLR